MTAVIEYHAYIIGEDGYILRRVNLFCTSDDAASEQAARLVDGHDVELWRGSAKVATFVVEPSRDGPL